ncbi:hypothetical protein P872_24275 [Rhodonellum psychrophilum GCM71 = DSM 17998]|uniref:Uncharacterized protein n=1 Tax=Rhodonellum psychrophilum GCM71 = DSM 17998 TaxID=1123057 RepID=U5C3A0_9BACT|nr:hypothetical protein P872_24275 [Rhodonellum psychrophilum GCM71 = DSM 17998]
MFLKSLLSLGNEGKQAFSHFSQPLVSIRFFGPL